MGKPLVIDLCCGLGGWSAGFLAEGWDCIGFDIEKHEYGDKRYPADLILKSILELNGYDLRAVNPALVVASPPCQEFSYMAMPWKRGKQIAGALREQCPFPEVYDGSRTVAELTALYDACFRIARQAGCPIVLENVKGAQPWVGMARAHFGSYYLWGDVESVGGRIVAARPQFGQSLQAARRQNFNPDGTAHGQGSWFAIADSKERGSQKREGRNFHAFENGLGSSPSFNGGEHETRGVATKNGGGSWFNQAHNTESGVGQNPVTGPSLTAMERLADLESRRDESGAMKGTGGGWFEKPYRERGDLSGQFNSKSSARKAASAMIAEIPFDLASYIARVFKPS